MTHHSSNRHHTPVGEATTEVLRPTTEKHAALTPEAKIRTTLGAATSIVAATAIAVATTVGCYFGLKGEIAALSYEIRTLQSRQDRIESDWRDHESRGPTTMNVSQPKVQTP